MTTFQTASDGPNLILAAGEALIGLAEAGRPTGTPVCTVSRWISRGILRNGRRVKLEHVRVGAKLKTSAEALSRFFLALSGPPEIPPPAPSPAERRRAVDRAEAELVAAGV